MQQLVDSFVVGCLARQAKGQGHVGAGREPRQQPMILEGDADPVASRQLGWFHSRDRHAAHAWCDEPAEHPEERGLPTS